MSLQPFIEDFSLLVDAPNSVAKLRELILRLAVEGKLIAQDPSDEPVSELLQRINADKKQIAKTGNGNKKAVADAYKGDGLLTLPTNWEWVCLDQITNTIHYGYTASANELLTDVRLLRITDIQNGKVDWARVPGCEIDKEKVGGYKLANNDILIARTGGTIGKSYLVENLDVVVVFASYLIRAIPNRYLFAKYLKIFLESDLYWKQLYERSMGTGQPNVNATSLKSLAVPLPPIEEQKRIVTKVAQLMQVCDELEARQQAKLESRVRLNAAILAPLNKAASLTPKELEQAATRLADNFDTLYDSIDTVSKLRETILQLAVQGKLESQDPNDQLARVLLAETKKEKERQLKAKKSKQIEPLPPITHDDFLNMPTPKGWDWAWLGDLARFVDYRGRTPLKTESGVKLLTAKNVRMGFISEYPQEFVSEDTYDEVMTRGLPQFGDILFTTEAPLGNVAQLLTNEPVALAQRIIDLQTFKPFFAEYLKLCLMSPLLQQAIMDRATGMTAAGIKASKLKKLPVPVPPLAEQKRIVAKVNQLMSLCDELEAKLRQAEIDSEKLMNAAVKHVLDSVCDTSKTTEEVFA